MMSDESREAEIIIDDIDLFSDEYQIKPFPTYRALRRECPVFHEPTYGNFVLSRHTDVQRLRDVEWLSAAHGVDPAGRFPPGTYPDVERTDPPRHRRLRTLLNHSLSPKAVREWEPDVRRIFEEHFDAVTADDFDVVDAICYPAPAAVMCEIMGFPESRRDDYRRWSNALMSRLGRDIARDQRDALVEMSRFIRREAKQRFDSPSDDLLSTLVHTELEGQRLDENEVVAHGVFLLAAGHETTTNLLGSIVMMLIKEPGLFKTVAENRKLIPALIEETLRLEAPIQAICRTTKTEKTLHDVSIPEDARVMFALGSAGRDPEVFDDPDSLQLDRDGMRRHMAFGYGDHICLGSRLARLEASIFLELLFDRYTSLSLAADPTPWQSSVARGFHKLPVHAHAKEHPCTDSTA